MVVGEIGFYWGHRWSHEIPLLVAVPRRSSQRDACELPGQHPGPPGRHGVHPAVRPHAALRDRSRLAGRPNPTLVPALVLLVGSMLEFLHPRQLRWRLGLFEEVLATPAFHHWHHTYEDHKDHNYSSMLPFVDRLFGTSTCRRPGRRIRRRDADAGHSGWPVARAVRADRNRALAFAGSGRIVEGRLTPAPRTDEERPLRWGAAFFFGRTQYAPPSPPVSPQCDEAHSQRRSPLLNQDRGQTSRMGESTRHATLRQLLATGVVP